MNAQYRNLIQTVNTNAKDSTDAMHQLVHLVEQQRINYRSYEQQWNWVNYKEQKHIESLIRKLLKLINL
jgi:hypothetical protein